MDTQAYQDQLRVERRWPTEDAPFDRMVFEAVESAREHPFTNTKAPAHSSYYDDIHAPRTALLGGLNGDDVYAPQPHARWSRTPELILGAGHRWLLAGALARDYQARKALASPDFQMRTSGGPDKYQAAIELAHAHLLENQDIISEFGSLPDERRKRLHLANLDTHLPFNGQPENRVAYNQLIELTTAEAIRSGVYLSLDAQDARRIPQALVNRMTLILTQQPGHSYDGLIYAHPELIGVGERVGAIRPDSNERLDRLMKKAYFRDEDRATWEGKPGAVNPELNWTVFNF